MIYIHHHLPGLDLRIFRHFGNGLNGPAWDVRFIQETERLLDRFIRSPGSGQIIQIVLIYSPGGIAGKTGIIGQILSTD